MPLNITDMQLLLMGRSGTIPAGSIPEEVKLHLEAKSTTVYLSSQSLKHILGKHDDMELPDIALATVALDEGLWIGDRNNSCCVSYLHSITKQRYKIAIKVANDGHELYLTAMHKMRPRQTAALLKRGKKLRNHK